MYIIYINIFSSLSSFSLLISAQFAFVMQSMARRRASFREKETSSSFAFVFFLFPSLCTLYAVFSPFAISFFLLLETGNFPLLFFSSLLLFFCCCVVWSAIAVTRSTMNVRTCSIPPTHHALTISGKPPTVSILFLFFFLRRHLVFLFYFKTFHSLFILFIYLFLLLISSSCCCCCCVFFFLGDRDIVRVVE